MQKNKTEFNYTVKRLVTLSLAVSVGLFNSLPQVSAQSSEEISSHSESYSSDEQTGNEGSLQNWNSINLLDTVYPESHPRHSAEQYNLLASMARQELTVSNDDIPPIPETEQVTAYCCLQTVISFITWAFGPCFRGVLGSHKKD